MFYCCSVKQRKIDNSNKIEEVKNKELNKDVENSKNIEDNKNKINKNINEILKDFETESVSPNVIPKPGTRNQVDIDHQVLNFESKPRNKNNNINKNLFIVFLC